MARPRSIVPTSGELEILNVLWRLKVATIRDVHDELVATRSVASTTVATMMQVMLKKGLLEVVDERRPQKYRAVLGDEQTKRAAIADVLKRFFGGSRKRLMQALLQKDVPTSERAEVRKLLDELE
jgi:BlaI family transcriptional regulator, penicillinase repressor